MELVDALWHLNVISSRIQRSGSDFILSGPMNLWLQGFKVRPKPYFVVVTSREYSGRIVEVLSIGARRRGWEEWWNGVKRGLEARLNLRGAEIAVVADPEMAVGEAIVGYRASDLARESSMLIVGGMVVRLAPLHFEASLYEALGGKAPWRVEGLGGIARR
ncbi:hypothetical protein APE_2330 [Aeropyrum pernix K1]|uniref:Uncharacterized protein n=1 Tax=Aeropyrum pernix (strain ATCC 700893 / DSM 11879 / JCM 9820 / NBRC 100138 / K1) TaxID=272557 RepID=Q9Y9F8_AERPE|nr:hypothetical protein [Aeropyrum pernix]BAA81342.1 hypothetical protein APE_2330 [Aeropyrum pernix K1]